MSVENTLIREVHNYMNRGDILTEILNNIMGFWNSFDPDDNDDPKITYRQGFYCTDKPHAFFPLELLPLSPRVFDFGCGVGTDLVSLKRVLPNLRAGFYDISDDRLGIVNSMLKNEVDDEYDALIMREVLEHMENPFPALEEHLGKLKSGGVLYTNIHDHEPAKLHVRTDLGTVRMKVLQECDVVIPNYIYRKR